MELVGKDEERVPARLGAKPEVPPLQGSWRAQGQRIGFESPFTEQPSTVHSSRRIGYRASPVTDFIPDRGWVRRHHSLLVGRSPARSSKNREGPTRMVQFSNQKW